MEQKGTWADAIAKIQKILQIGCSIDRSGFFVKILKLAREVQRLLGLIDSKDLAMQMMVGLNDEASSSREKPFKLKEEKDRLTVESKVVLALRSEISGFKTATGSIVDSSWEVKSRKVETERNLKNALETIPASGSRGKTLTEKVSIVT